MTSQVLALHHDFHLFWQHSLRYLIICGGLFAINLVALFTAIEQAKDHQQAIEVGLINYLWPSFTVVLSVLLITKNVSFSIIPGALFSLFGIFIVLTQHASVSWKTLQNIQSNIRAYLSALIAALTWAVYSVLTNLWANPDAASAVSLFIPFTGIVFALIALKNRKKGPISDKWAGKPWWKYRHSVATLLAYIFWDLSMRKANVTFVASLSFFTPFFATLIVGLYLKEKITNKLWLGCFFIIIGSFLSWVSIYR